MNTDENDDRTEVTPPTGDLQTVSMDEHRDAVRDFLGQIDEEAAYLGD